MISGLKTNSTVVFFIEIHSIQGRTAITMYGVTRKSTKRSKYTGNMLIKNLQIIGVC